METNGNSRRWIPVAVILVVIIIAGSSFILSRCTSEPAIEIALAPEREITGEVYVNGEVVSP